MTIDFSYDASTEPPAPMVPVRVAAPGDETSVMIVCLVDSGADITVIPESTARKLALPAIGPVRVEGVGGDSLDGDLYAAAIDLDGETDLYEVLALGEQALLGRDLLNRRVLTLDGPRLRLRLG